MDNGEQGIPERCHGRADGKEEGVEWPKSAPHRYERDGLMHYARHEKRAHHGSKPPPGDNGASATSAFSFATPAAIAVSAISTKERRELNAKYTSAP